MLISAVLHAGSVLGMQAAGLSCVELDPSPPTTDKPFGVSLVFIETPSEYAAVEGPKAGGENARLEERERRRPVVAKPRALHDQVSNRREAGVSTTDHAVAEVVAPRSVVASEQPVRGYREGIVAVPQALALESEWEPDQTELPRSVDRPPMMAANLSSAAAGERPGAGDGWRGQHRPQQNRELAIEKIKRRIEKVMPLVYWNPRLENQVAGRARVRFRMTRRGYVHELQLIEVTGELELRRATRAVLHLAEPYLYVPDWIEIDLVFRG